MLSQYYCSAQDMEELPPREFDNRQNGLLEELLRSLAVDGYSFTTVTPLTHERVLLRFDGIAKNTRDVFGWNLPFESNILPPPLFQLMKDGDLIFKGGELFRSKIRVSSLGKDLFLHSHFPTNDAHAVFFGPDTYRFARFITQSLHAFQLQSQFYKPASPLKILDVGCGSGAGGIAAVRSLVNQPYKLYLNDLNPVALEYAMVCANVAEIPVTTVYEDFFNIKDLEFDLILSNPPYLSDPAARLYRDGGSHMGLELSLRIVKHSLNLLAPGGQLLLYTGVAMKSDENNPFLSELIPHLANERYRWFYEEIDPDIFGEELDKLEYKNANRIAAVGLRILRTC